MGSESRRNGKEERLWLQRPPKEVGSSPLFYTCIFFEQIKAATRGAVHAEMDSALLAQPRVTPCFPSPAAAAAAAGSPALLNNICTSAI